MPHTVLRFGNDPIINELDPDHDEYGADQSDNQHVIHYQAGRYRDPHAFRTK
jgi:hypothetical protein